MLAIKVARMTDALHHMDSTLLQAEAQQVFEAQRDPKKFEPLYTKYFERIANFVYHRSGDKELSFEITAQVFYKALNSLAKFRPGRVPFSAWLYRIAVNEVNESFRKSKRRRVLNIDTAGLKDLRQSMEDDYAATRDHDLFTALSALDAEDLELVNMRFFEKRAFSEIAGILGLGEGACKMKLYRILEKLRKTMRV